MLQARHCRAFCQSVFIPPFLGGGALQDRIFLNSVLPHLVFLEKVIQKDFAADYPAVFVFVHAIRRDHSQLKGFPAVCAVAEDIYFVPQFLIIVLIDFIFIHRKVHFTDRNDLIAPVNPQINLCTGLPIILLLLFQSRTTLPREPRIFPVFL